MTKNEFEQEARRVLRAFDFEAEGVLSIEEKAHSSSRKVGGRMEKETKTVFLCRAEQGSIRLGITREVGRNTNVLHIRITEATDSLKDKGGLFFLQSFSKQSLFYLPQQNFDFPRLMFRGLFRLGYDIEALAKQIEMSLTAHEKMEWELERREANRGGEIEGNKDSVQQ